MIWERLTICVAVHFTYVKEIKPGLPLFLFNYSDRQLHGICEAASNKEMNINPYALVCTVKLLMQKTYLLVNLVARVVHLLFCFRKFCLVFVFRTWKLAVLRLSSQTRK